MDESSTIEYYTVVVMLVITNVYVYKNAPYKQTKEELSVWSIVVFMVHLAVKRYSPS
jgi:hypothetical protein